MTNNLLYKKYNRDNKGARKNTYVGPSLTLLRVATLLFHVLESFICLHM